MPSPATPNDYPLELAHPDISPYKSGNSGIEYAWTYKSSVPGPHVMVSAVVHGNELCGAITLDWLLQAKLRPDRGTLTFAFMNVAAYESYDPASPNSSRYVDEDFNRVWGVDVLEGNRDSIETRRARIVRPLLDTVDLLLDIHSMQHPCMPLMMSGPTVKGRELARQVGIPQTIVGDAGHAAGIRMRDYGGFIQSDSEKNAVLVECGQHWVASSEDIAKETAMRFLRVTGAVTSDFAQHIGTAQIAPTRSFEVTDAITITGDTFTFDQAWTGGEVLPEKGTLIGLDGDKQVVTPYNDCMLVMPTRRLSKGLTAVRLARKVAD